jgi:hypothetical protein
MSLHDAAESKDDSEAEPYDPREAGSSNNISNSGDEAQPFTIPFSGPRFRLVREEA